MIASWNECGYSKIVQIVQNMFENKLDFSVRMNKKGKKRECIGGAKYMKSRLLNVECTTTKLPIPKCPIHLLETSTILANLVRFNLRKVSLV